MDDPRYPIGKFAWPDAVSAAYRTRYMDVISTAPERLRQAVAGLSPAQMEIPYREGGWTLRQVVHHLPESHMHSYIRFKLALTEEEPIVKPYDEAAWARTNDVAETPLETSLGMLQLLHERWLILLRGISGAGWQRRFIHPELGPVSLENNLALYAWHGDHHIAQILRVRDRL